MGIPGFFRWIINQFPECLIRDRKVYSHCQTLFIDLCQLSFRAEEYVQRKHKNSSRKEQTEMLFSEFAKRVKNTILTVNPHNDIFAFFDGPNPAIKFQRQRERWFKRETIDNYVIDPTEYKLSDINENLDDSMNDKLNELFNEITTNCKFLRAKRIFFSTTYAPGEAEHKYFDVLKHFKRGEYWKPNQLHSIHSTDNDLIFLALQFFDERFLIIRDYDTIIDISILRDLILYMIFQKDLYFSIETADKDSNSDPAINRVKDAFRLVSLIPISLKQQVINDIIALSFIIGNDFLPPVPDFSANFSFSNLLNSYKRINEKYFLSIISNKKDDSVFTPLIINNCFCVSSLQSIIKECFNKPKKDIIDPLAKTPNDDNLTNQNNIDNLINNNDTILCNQNESMGTKDFSNANINSNLVNNDNSNNNNNYNNSNNLNSNSVNGLDNSNTSDECDMSMYSENMEELKEASQQMLRVFNFTWLYYSIGCPSWSYYFPFKKAPPLRKAITLMQQEGPDVFRTPDAMQMTEPMFKRFVLHPVECKEDLPWCLYTLKIPPSEISHFWPLGARNVDDVPMFDLQVMKKYYNERKKMINPNELKYNRCDQVYFTYVNMNKPKRNDF